MPWVSQFDFAMLGFAFAQLLGVIMVVRSSWLRGCAALLFSAVLLAAGLACHKSSPGPLNTQTFAITGNVTYTRVPLHYDANGVPTGLETDSTKFTVLPARGVRLRVFQLRPQTNPDYSVQQVWAMVALGLTDINGNYTISSGILKDYPTFVELASIAVQPGTNNASTFILADPAGVYSSARVIDRPNYVIRKAADGSSSSTDATHSSIPESDQTVNFTVGLNDPWLVVRQDWWNPAVGSFPYPETVAAGSRIPAILDAIYSFAYIFGNAMPFSSGSELDLHYRPGVSTRRGDFVEYNPLVFPQSYDGSIYHYFGSINAGGTVDGVVTSDDAYDLGALAPILARNNLTAQHKCNFIPTGVPTTSLAPDLTLVEGLAYGMAAVIAQSPYLAGPNPANRYSPPLDIRDLSALAPAQVGPYSAPTIAALTWDLALIDQSITAPGTLAQWQTLVPNNLIRFFALRSPVTTQGSNLAVITDCVSIYTQLARLQETESIGETSNLANFFPDSVLTPLAAKYNIPWSTAANAILPRYTANWGTDPNSLVNPLPTSTFSMAQAVKINRYYLDTQGVEQTSLYYPNNSKGEAVYASFASSLDHTYNLSVHTVPVLPPGAAMELVVDGNLQQAYVFSAGNSAPVSLVLAGNPSDLTTPIWHAIRIRVLSPTTVVPDTQVSVQLAILN